jgi:hypothetical protein
MFFRTASWQSVSLQMETQLIFFIVSWKNAYSKREPVPFEALPFLTKIG